VHDFNRLWTGQFASVIGSAISNLAIPTTAIVVLHASTFAVGALGATGYIAFPVLGVVAGVWVDRWPRRTVLVVCDIVRALALATIPLAAALHALTLAQLFVVAFVTGVATVFFDVAYQAYLPDLVPEARLRDANARLEFSKSTGAITGNAAAGALIATIGSAAAVACDAASFVISVIALGSIRERHAAPRATPSTLSFGRQVRDGIASVTSNAALRRIVACTATSNLGSSMLGAVYLVFAYRTLHVSPATIGIVLAAGNTGFVGALLASKIVQRFGLATTLIATMLIAAVVQALVPLASLGTPVPLLIVEGLIANAAVPIYNIAQVTWRQSVVPPELRGRMNATVRTVAWGTLPLGALLGAALSGTIGLVPTLVCAVVVQLGAVLWLLSDRVYALGRSPTAV